MSPLDNVRHLRAVPNDEYLELPSSEPRPNEHRPRHQRPSEAPIAIETHMLGRRYRKRWAIQNCDLRIPRGSVVALVGQNGAGKSTLLHLLVGLTRPTSGSVHIFGSAVSNSDASALAHLGFVAQEKPLYTGLTVSEMIKIAARLNKKWDHELAVSRLSERRIPLNAKIGTLSGGERTQVALTLALAKLPSVLILDEPLANLDPLARRAVMGLLMAELAEREVTVIISSHSLGELARVCDRLILLDSGHVELTGQIDDLVAEHRRFLGPVELAQGLTRRYPVVSDRREGRQAMLLLRTGTEHPVLDPRWAVDLPTLEDLVLAYMMKSDT